MPLHSSGPVLPLNTGTVALRALPTLVGTFIKHLTLKKKLVAKSEAREELVFDEAFKLARGFLESSMQYSVEDLQRFGNTYVPAPWWVRVIDVTIPTEFCSDSAKYVLEAFGRDEIENLVGGEQWWQRRGHAQGGIDAEWIAMKSDLKHAKLRELKDANKTEDQDQHHRRITKASVKEAKAEHAERVKFQRQKHGKHNAIPAPVSGEEDDESEDDLGGPDPRNAQERAASSHYTDDLDSMRCILYIHGGGYYFGSVNTHRYTIWRYARKIGGRAFAVHYRLAPQYPFPCALADCLASYLYLIQPPKGALHRPIHPSRIVIAGDSAGGGMTLALLTLLRDVGIPPPAGGVLISPWCDLTHSFPSVLQNTPTDIIPPYGFIHQPSPLWPPPSTSIHTSGTGTEKQQKGLFHRFSPSHSSSTPLPSTSTTESSVAHKHHWNLRKSSSTSHKHQVQVNDTPAPLTEDPDVLEHLAKLNSRTSSELHHLSQSSQRKKWMNPFSLEAFGELFVKNEDEKTGGEGDEDPLGLKGEAKVEPSKVIRIKAGDKIVEIKDQIQFYATNDQLTHPYCSPALAPSLGGLPPLFVIAGDKEVLRDEIIYIAHRAANPDAYPLREGLRQANARRLAASQYYPPTRVHLQVYDGACHVLPMFSFTTPAKYCFRSIASFCKSVMATEVEPLTEHHHLLKSSLLLPGHQQHAQSLPQPVTTTTTLEGKESILFKKMYSKSEEVLIASPAQSLTSLETDSLNSFVSLVDRDDTDTITRQFETVQVQEDDDDVSLSSRTTSTSSSQPSPNKSIDTTITVPSRQNTDLSREEVETAKVDASTQEFMIRERLSVKGKVRLMEPIDQVAALNLDASEIGVIKEGPILRWLEGKTIWESKFKSKSNKIQSVREHNLKKSNLEEMVRSRERLDQQFRSKEHVGHDSLNRAWELIGENPPPSSIAARRDVREARKLAQAVDKQPGSRSQALNVWTKLNDMISEPIVDKSLKCTLSSPSVDTLIP